MAGLQAPLSTLRPAPRGALRMTRGQSGLLFLIAVGTPIAGCPPHRSRRARFAHRAPTLGD